MISCKRAAELISLSRDRPLGLVERVRLRLHLWACGMCRRFRKQSGVIEEALRQSPRSEESPGMSGDAKERIRRALRERREDSSA